MASLAMVCGLVEQEVISLQSETFSVLKSVNDYFYSPASSSSEGLSSLGNFNQCLQRPQTGDATRSGTVCCQKKTALLQWTSGLLGYNHSFFFH